MTRERVPTGASRVSFLSEPKRTHHDTYPPTAPRAEPRQPHLHGPSRDPQLCLERGRLRPPEGDATGLRAFSRGPPYQQRCVGIPADRTPSMAGRQAATVLTQQPTPRPGLIPEILGEPRGRITQRQAHPMTPNQLTPPAAASAALSTIVFDHDGQNHPICTARDPKGQTWWVARDVCEALGITKQSRALERVNAADKGRTKLSTPGGLQGFVTVNQSGLFALAFQSRKPAARAFQHWVTSVVLPAIAQDGAYIRGEEQALGAATAEELRARLQELESVAARAIQAKEQRGLCGIEERAARRDAFKLLSRGRKPRRKGPPKAIKGRGAI